MSILTLGIDPGLTGGFALLDPLGQLIAVDDLPVICDAKTKWIDAERLVAQLLKLRGGHTLQATTERVHAMPRNGSQAAFSQGLTFGSILSVLQVVGARIEFVTPQTWKKQYGLLGLGELTDTQRKQRSLDKARLLFPTAELHLAKHHGRAESILISHFAYSRQTAKAA